MEEMIVRVTKKGSRYICTDIASGNKYTEQVSYSAKRNAYESGKYLKKRTNTATGKVRWVLVEPAAKAIPVEQLDGAKQSDIVAYIQSSHMLKPKNLVMPDLKWKYLVRSAIRGKNIMMTGYSGCGKTLAAKSLMLAFGTRPNFYFNLGATQDPRSTLIGNTHFNKETGTYFSESLFVKAISTPNAIILMDEISRAHHEAWNILMTVFDEKQRYLRLDEADGAPTIKVAAGVTFIATANIGTEFTSTRVMDRALLDRFIVVEMGFLNAAEETGLLKYSFPSVDEKKLKAIAEISDMTRKEFTGSDSKLTNVISTRMSVEMASLIYDGFRLDEAAEVAIYPFFTNDGADSERVFVKQLVQKHIEVEEDPEKLYDTEDKESKDDDDNDGDLFDADDIKKAVS